MQKIKLCFVSDSEPNFLGGTSIYIQNIFLYMRKKKLFENFEITCLYPSNRNEHYKKNRINYVGIKANTPYPLKFFIYGKKVSKYLENNRQDIINSHAMAGYFLKYFKKENEKVIHTYHGVGKFFYAIHLQRNNIIKKNLSHLLIKLVSKLEKPPINHADRILGVSDHIKKELEEVYHKKITNYCTIRNCFSPSFFLNGKKNTKKITYLYVGRGGVYRKGLDRFVKLINETAKINYNFKAVIIGPRPDKEVLNKLKEINSDYIYLPVVGRQKIAEYYKWTDIFFCLSRYEGGAPIFTVSEAIAANCLIVCSEDSKQEILNKTNSIIIDDFDEKNAQYILDTFNDVNQKNKLKRNAKKVLNKLKLTIWGEKYIEYLIK